MQTAAAAWLGDLGSKLSGIARQFDKAAAPGDIRKDGDDSRTKLPPLGRVIVKAAEEADHGEMVQQLLPTIKDVAKDSAKRGVKQVAPSVSDIRELLSLANENAIEWAEEHAAELVTQIEETTRDGVRRIVESALEQGLTNDELADAIEEAHEFGADRAEMIARTETARASIAGNVEGWRSSGVVDGKQWMLAQDEYCKACEAMSEAYPDPIPLNAVFELKGESCDGPPFHPRCVLPDTLVSAAGITTYYKRRFDGEVIRITIEGNANLSATKNHPILTRRGWIAAGLLKVGDEVAKCLCPEKLVLAINPHDHHIETRIQDVAGSLRMSGEVLARRMPMTAEAFHGDGVANSEVEIVRTARLLPYDSQPGVTKNPKDSLLTDGQGPANSLNGEGSSAQLGKALFSTSGNVMGGSRSTQPGCRTSTGSLDAIGLAHGSDGVTGAAENIANSEAVATKRLGEIGAGFTGGVACGDGGYVGIGKPSLDDFGLVRRSDVDSLLPEPSADDLLCDLGLLGDGAGRFAGLVRFAKVTDVFRFDFSGHVFNLETVDGWYVANGIITHNCRCDLLPGVIDGDAVGDNE